MGNIRNSAADNQNLQNLSGRAFTERIAAKGTQTIKNIIPAGASQYFPCDGEFFYFEAASGPINVAPDCAYGKGVENPYGTGLGLRLDRINSFHGLQIRNPDASNSVFFQMKVGFDAFIDNRLIYPDLLFKQITIQTYSTYRSAATSATVTDLSGTVITDNNGNQWYAVNRQLLCLFNNDSTEYWFLTNTADTKDEGSLYAGHSIQLPVSGNFKVFQGGSHSSSVNGIITEIYNCLPKIGV